MNKRGIWMLVAVAMIAASCSTTLSREDAIDDMVDEGLERTTAECVMEYIEAEGFTADDGAGDDVAPGFEEALSVGFAECASDSDVANVLGDVDLDEVRQQFIDSFVASGVVDAAQAGCIIAELEAQGVTLVDLSQAGIGGGDASVEAKIADATVGCITGG